MEKRINIMETQAQAAKAMYGLEGYLASTQLPKAHKELIKIRASQINGCAFCLDMHTKDALRNGESSQRIFLLNAWRETNLFSPEEKVLLAITEEVTLIHQHGLSEETYSRARAIFDEGYIAQVIMAVVIINAWNRIAVSTRLEIPQ
ncbi:carboxymuconolactone decarboxylase family protein [Telluribacter sp. SYSU D00476]|uniref:carboxymuconolactone decarboxylase family protein n=1 Tax=Telluribacter sp. SYSU D00476 TaxID=2811430 RepID=UPI001FF59FB0|nr:carboxymuconolactone decarboxylase family protein [Telluribacter sp. SYSU D00476]